MPDTARPVAYSDIKLLVLISFKTGSNIAIALRLRRTKFKFSSAVLNLVFKYYSKRSMRMLRTIIK